MIRLLKFIFWSCVALVCTPIVALTGTFLYLSPSLPSVDALRNVQLQIPLRVYSADEKLIAEFGEMRRSPISYDEIPPDFINALLAAEDDNFANHYGVDPSSLLRAASQLLKTGHIQTGGSTITMQVAKNYFLTNERSFSRKITEILLALQIERELSKDQILELYVNKIYLGNRAYGIEAAAQIYYGKSIRELSLAQMAMIAGLPKAPSRYNPLVNAQRSKERRDWILGRMRQLGKIDQARYEEALAAPIDAHHYVQPPELEAPYIAEMVRAEMVGRYGSAAYTEGYRVYTTVPSDRQEMATRAVREGLIEYDQRHGYRGPESRYPGMNLEQWQQELQRHGYRGGLAPAIVTQVNADGLQVLLRDGQQYPVAWDSMQWARPFLATNSMGPRPRNPSEVAKVGDLIRVSVDSEGKLGFSQVPQAQSALISLAPEDGSVQALVGGFSYEQSKYNRAMQARRQPGSSFKPFLYAAALDDGYTPATLVNDAPIVFVDEQINQEWRPKNDNNTFLGPIRLREALYRSRNLVSIRLLQSIGIDYALNYATRFGFDRQYLPRNLSLALGTASLTPMEVATGWSTFANGGYKIEPYVIRRIESRDGEVLFKANPPRAAIAPDGSNRYVADSDADASSGTDQPGNAESFGQADAQPLTHSERTDPPSTSDDAPNYARQVVDPRTTYILGSMLQDVIKRGTGRRALALGRNDLAGKTGTTNDSKDSWFSGYNADLVTSVWSGFDQPESLGRNEYGGTVSLPIWMRYMGAALKDMPEHPPAEPEGIVTLRVDPVSGRAAGPNTPGAYFELFKNEDTPPSNSEFTPGSQAPGSPLPSDDAAPIMDIF